MDLDKPLVNRVAQSGIITLNLEDYFPTNPIVVFDIKEYLFHGLILKEKDFREAMKNHDWTQYQGKHLAITCSTDAIVPIWAYQLIALQAAPYALLVVFGSIETLLTVYYHETLAKINWTEFQDKYVVIKGCGSKPVPVAAYTEMAKQLLPYAKSIMYGEPCSTVPLHKRK
jgi:hypothetical protein